MSMKIGFDVSQTGAQKAGCGFFAHALALGLVNDAREMAVDFYPTFGDHFFDPRMPDENPYPRAKSSYGPKFRTQEEARQFWNAPGLEAQLRHPDIIHSNNFWCPLGLNDTRLVYTFYDLSFLVEPSWTTDVNRIGCFSGNFRASVNADWIVAISEASRRHFLEVFPHFPEDRIRVIYPCSRFSDAKREGSRPKLPESIVPERFWLSVGTIEPRKNHLGLARAYANYREHSKDPLPLILAGGAGWLMDDFQRELKALGVLDDVILTGYVSDDELIWLYRHCFANLYPSFFEGFGLPILEAMQFGAPTFASKSSSIPEILGNAGPLLAPQEHEAWASAMSSLEQNPERRLEMKALGAERVAQFQWEASRDALVTLYEEALATPKRFPLDAPE